MLTNRCGSFKCGLFHLSEGLSPRYSKGALRVRIVPIHSEGEVYSSFLQARHAVKFVPRQKWGVYLYLLEGGPVRINEQRLETLGAAMVTDEKELDVSAELDAELLLVHVQLT
jgi:redox-sensitive bicupin YhaK (pirin superfamily)